MCVRHRSHGAVNAAWVYRPWHRLVCPRHQQAGPDPRLDRTVRTWAVPELAAVHHSHQRLLRHPGGVSAWMAARAITTGWYDHQQHLTGRWHHCLNQLVMASPHLNHAGGASPARLARDLVAYPETVALARTLAALPPTTNRTTNDTLALIAHQLSLARLAPAVNDPLRAFLTHTRL
ncbi:hypothetical protein [Streptomyces sp. H27-C3]|uniref:hypothetical protein n=1 Tax=Streptomyces sp. H27-C3 TaxID=3046305 RepID=UPI0024B93EF0|nr:hypothetical protein [Streptomyces sp. H27-C3]MDJ0465914.1 hypothetical protein [Streptomyces sp. H27-C3]